MAKSYSALSYSTLIHMLTLKLTSTNYSLWKNQVETLFQEQDNFLDGSAKPSISTAMVETLGCKTFAVVWHTLEIAYSLASEAREIELNE
ncbi:unnamed protein product [Lactuca virosa]|uniref:Retrotransposon Copia-like N-terminal domain-containing protein n=1 Tax=Lactuca virosa TaxID=75947 RepID=A0AAU9M9H7_9ASTR|nr:unnamed protein product [Lactuca virosa]